jgi:prepilin-type processing-associated H-X9-DG protein
MASFSGGTESARAARCLGNMKNLANACQTFAMRHHYYPNAGIVKEISMDESSGINQAKVKYTVRKSWIGCDKDNVGMYCDNDRQATDALTNSCLWTYVAHNRQTFICPSHAKRFGAKLTPRWSYLMNGYFGWTTPESGGSSTGGCKKWYGNLDQAERRLLFSEVPFMNNSSWQPDDPGYSTDTDGILQASAESPVKEADIKGVSPAYYPGEETIGANHTSGRNLFAHVVFADGHVEKLRIPYTGSIKNPEVDEGQLKLLTSLLCGGKDYSFNGREYRSLTDAAQ